MVQAQSQGQPTLDLPMEAMYPQANAPVMLSEAEAEACGGGLSSLVGQFTQMVKPKPQKAPKAMAKPPAKVPLKRPQPALYTEERLEPSRSSQSSDKSADMSGLWLATTIVLIVVSAFGAGFLIMKPLLSNSR
ncbi:MAG: hypothetical protein HC922_00725 [Leptolyngbyaceae cyanobacterium SM2_3_12]|nr:hypothetical protein [Leptolyngbyaceae cyanobacterium SM2_3_12]